MNEDCNRNESCTRTKYLYDGDGLRVKKSSGTLYWRTVWGDTLSESDLSGNITNEYVFFAGRRIARISSGTVNYFYSDALGTVHTITDSTGHACYDATFTPYGQEVLNPNITQTCSSSYKFTGYEYDSETGLYYGFARYYNPRLGRFMSSDPLAGGPNNPQSQNHYAYVLNSPANLADPTGLLPSSGDGSSYGGQRCRDGNKPPCKMQGGGGIYYFGCTLDGVYAPCGFVDSLIDVAGVSECPNDDCSVVTSTGQLQQYKCFEAGPAFGNGCAYFSTLPGPGYPYSSQQAAATASFYYTFQVYTGTATTKYEYGDNLYELPDGSFSFTPPIANGPVCDINTGCFFNEDPSAIPPDTMLAGLFHTHPGGGLEETEDYAIADRLGVPTFIGFPPGPYFGSGCLFMYAGQVPGQWILGGSQLSITLGGRAYSGGGI